MGTQRLPTAITPRVAFTGFGPFDTFAVNPSWTVAQAAARGLMDAGVPAIAEEVPVTYAAAEDAALRLAAVAPVRVHVGVAGGRDCVTVEEFARAFARGTPDVAGVTEPDFGVETSGERESADAGRLVDALVAVGVAAARSQDAGGYVCNAMLFHALGAAARQGDTAVFVHVPPLDPRQATALGQDLAAAVLRAWPELRHTGG